MRPVEMERPTIKVFTKPGHGRDETLRQLVFGIEEEGIPCEVSEENFTNAMALAWEASQQSRLSVGLGLDRDTLVLQFSKLKENEPLFQISARSPEWDVRAMGANAARLVKKLPFKLIGEDL